MLTEITAQDFDVQLDLRYASADNITGVPIYCRPACYLHPEATILLKKAIALAAPLGYQLLIFDGFRPTEAQWCLWNYLPDPDFIADPRRGSPHSRGAAIDLTLIERRTGQILDMGTGFDEMIPQSNHARQDISQSAQRNRLLLLGLMSAAGWDFYQAEWWHYQLFQARIRYPLLTDSAAGTCLMPDSRLV